MFKIMCDVYCWSHDHFDDDMTICCLLVNESLEQAMLSHDEDAIYLSIQNEQIRLFEQQSMKRKQQQDGYRERKRHRLDDGNL
jgi:hypothetical protein